MTDLQTAAENTVRSLRQNRAVLVTAESLTAGLLSGTIANVPGASDVLAGGFVVYSYAMKTALLNVSEALLKEQGAVNAEVACEMAEGALNAAAGATIAVSCTGVAGPGPSDGKPQGTVFIAISHLENGTQVHQHWFDGDRAEVRAATIEAALRHVHLALEVGGQ